MDLFTPTSELHPIPLQDAELSFMERLVLPGDDGTDMLARLVAETAWRQDSITVWNKVHLQPRLSAWYGNAPYRYSGMLLEPLPFTALQLRLKEAVEAATGHRYNSVLLNYYRDEHDSMGMHADDERELGPAPAIASLSFGAARTLVFKHKRLPLTSKLALGDGSLLLMAGPTQRHWKHGINKQRQHCGPRINLTFRHIY